MKTFYDFYMLLFYVLGGTWHNIDTVATLTFVDTMVELFLVSDELDTDRFERVYVFVTNDHLGVTYTDTAFVTMVQSYRDDNETFAAGVITKDIDGNYVFTVINKG